MEDTTTTTTTPTATATTRTKEDIKKDYATLCAQLGEKKFHVEVLQSETAQLINKISSLNTEMNTLNAATTTEATTHGSH